MKLKTDDELRKALHGLYLGLFRARKLSPHNFTYSRLTTILTAIMGVENEGWRVIGITPEALTLLASADFRKDRLPRKLCRGHLVDRVKTVRSLFERREPCNEELFFRVFLKNDRTIIMLTEQNALAGGIPSYIRITNPKAALFSNGGLMGWKHRKRERDFLAQLHARESHHIV